MDQLGKMIREKRLRKNETLKQMAKAIKCSESFARHIELAPHVPVSERLINNLARHYRISRGRLAGPAKKRKKTGTAYYKKYRENN